MDSVINKIHSPLIDWSKGHETIQGIALVGSYARGEARADSDIDLVILCREPEVLLRERSWVNRFGVVQSISEEDYGALTSLRVFYADDLEIEFGVTTEQWASTPIDPGTRQVLEGGFQIVYDPENHFEYLRGAFMGLE